MTRETIDRLREEASARIESDPHGALSRYQHLLKIDPADIDGWANCATLLMRLGQTEAAANGFARVLRLAQNANSTEWVSYAQRSLAHLKKIAPTPQSIDHALENATAPPSQVRPNAPDMAGEHSIDSSADGRKQKPNAVASAIASAALACVAGGGLLLLVTAGAVSQLWPYPFVRAALLQSIDNLMAGTLFGYLGAILLHNAWSRFRIGRMLIYLVAGALFSFALWLTLVGIVQLSGFFAECTNIETIKQACNIQIEEFEKMTPEAREKLNVLGL